MKNPRANKRQLELDRKAKAERKRLRRLEKPIDDPSAPPAEASADQGSTLQALADLHAAYEAKTVTFEEFEATKQELIGRLDVG